MKASLLLVLCMVTLACHSLKIVDNSAGNKQCCGTGNSINTDTQFCCLDSVFTISNTNNGNCCGSNTLKDNQQCCYAVDSDHPSKNDRAISSDLTCCGTSGYDSSSQICCGGHISSNTNNNRDCCQYSDTIFAGKTYNTETDLCCPDVKYNKKCTNGVSCFEASDNSHVVTNGLTNGQQCCGATGISSSQSCCNGHGIDSSLSCCSAGSYDSSTKICCEVDTTETLLLCDGSGNTGSVTTSQAKISTVGSNGLTCCNTLDGVGGTNAFTDSQFCCPGGAVFNQNSDNSLQCCGSKTYDTNSQTCCPKIRYSVQQVNSDCSSCGCNTYTIVATTTYNVGNVAAGSCCDGSAYDSNNKFCCPDDNTIGAKLFSISSSQNLDCCGFNSYNTDNDFCCLADNAINGVTYGKVFSNKGPSKTSASLDCCGFFESDSCGNVNSNGINVYDTSKQACPCGKVINIDDDLTQNGSNVENPECCGTSQYDGDALLCCAQSATLFDEDPAIGRTCCSDGKTRYNPGYQVCCEKTSSSCTKPCVPSFHAERDVEAVEEVEQTEQTEEIEKSKKKHKKSKSSKTKVYCGDHCCDVGNGLEGYFAEYQTCCGGNIVDYQGTDHSSPVTCCGTATNGELYNTLTHSCCYDLKISGSGCGLKASFKYAVYDTNTDICCSTSTLGN